MFTALSYYYFYLKIPFSYSLKNLRKIKMIQFHLSFFFLFFHLPFLNSNIYFKKIKKEESLYNFALK